jgi:Methyltransferase domain
VPPNCHFEVDDVEDEWQYNHKFDYIHGRFLVSCFKDARGVFQKVFDALAPGGYFELLDTRVLTCIDSSADGSQLMRWVNLMLEAATLLGRDFDKVGKYRGWMEDIGFVDITETYFAWPTNTWPRGRHHKTLGVWAGQDLKDGLEGFSMAALTRALGWSPDEVRSLLGGVKADLDDRNIHCYMPMYSLPYPNGNSG